MAAAPSTPALDAKARGNKLFAAGRFSAARDCYTEAIALDASRSIFFSNRALCSKSLGDWDRVEEDARKALDLSAHKNTKAGYLVGLCYIRRKDWGRAVAALSKACEMAQLENKSVKEQRDVTFALRDARKGQWMAEKEAHDAALERVADMLPVAISIAEAAEASKEAKKQDTAAAAAAAAAPLLDEGKRGAAAGEATGMDLMRDWCKVLSADSMGEILPRLCTESTYRERERKGVPEHLCCPLSFDLFVEPVVTPSGHSFERDWILKHLAKSQTHPLTRERLTPAMLVPNLALTEVVRAFLADNPWAWRE